MQKVEDKLTSFQVFWQGLFVCCCSRGNPTLVYFPW